jgi:hypothetical protein
MPRMHSPRANAPPTIQAADRFGAGAFCERRRTDFVLAMIYSPKNATYQCAFDAFILLIRPGNVKKIEPPAP